MMNNILGSFLFLITTHLVPSGGNPPHRIRPQTLEADLQVISNNYDTLYKYDGDDIQLPGSLKLRVQMSEENSEKFLEISGIFAKAIEWSPSTDSIYKGSYQWSAKYNSLFYKAGKFYVKDQSGALQEIDHDDTLYYIGEKRKRKTPE